MVFYRRHNSLSLINKRLFKINTSALNKYLNIEQQAFAKIATPTNTVMSGNDKAVVRPARQ